MSQLILVVFNVQIEASLFTDAISGASIRNASYRWEFTLANGDVVFPSELFKVVVEEGQTITLINLRDDVDVLQGEQLKGRCVALIPNGDGHAMTTYPSDPMIAVDLDNIQNPQIDDKPEQESKHLYYNKISVTLTNIGEDKLSWTLKVIPYLATVVSVKLEPKYEWSL